MQQHDIARENAATVTVATSLKAPAAYVYGDQNKEYPLLRRLGTVKKIEIPKCGHRPIDDNPEAFYRAIASFLQSVHS